MYSFSCPSCRVCVQGMVQLLLAVTNSKHRRVGSEFVMSLHAEIVITRQVMNRDRYRDVNTKIYPRLAGADGEDGHEITCLW